MISDNYILRPSWSAPGGAVQAMCTTRKGGVSEAPWSSLNLGGDHVGGDSPESVAENRQRLARFTGGLEVDRIGWLNQVHGTRVVELTPDNAKQVPEADASFTRFPGLGCVILTADCLPVVIADSDGTVVGGAAHAGWRSLSGGVLENLISAMAVEPDKLSAWLGPAIGPPDSFEVGPEVCEAFVRHSPVAENAFKTRGGLARAISWPISTAWQPCAASGWCLGGRWR